MNVIIQRSPIDDPVRLNRNGRPVTYGKAYFWAIEENGEIIAESTGSMSFDGCKQEIARWIAAQGKNS